MRLGVCLFPEYHFNLCPGSLANGPQSKSTSTEVCRIWAIMSSVMGRKRDRERGVDRGCAGVSREETCKAAEGLLTDWGPRREGNNRRGMGFWLGDRGRAVKHTELPGTSSWSSDLGGHADFGFISENTIT